MNKKKVKSFLSLVFIFTLFFEISSFLNLLPLFPFTLFF